MDQHLTPPDQHTETGYDNPALAPPPPYSEINSCHKEPLANSHVYVVPSSPALGKTLVVPSSPSLGKSLMVPSSPSLGKPLMVPGSPSLGRSLKDELYDPYDNRNVKHATTYSETLIHILKASLGTGILAMPNAFHNAGYLVGFIGTVIIGGLCTYSMYILIAAEYELCRRKKKPSMTYPETLEAALSEGPPFCQRLAPWGDFIGSFFLMMYQIGSCCIYMVFVSSNLKAVADQYIQPMDVRIYMLILLVPFILLNWVRNLKYLAPFSSVANIAFTISFIIIGYYVFDDMPSLSERTAVAPFYGQPLFFGTVLFAMEAIGVVMPLENEMQNPKRFITTFGVLNMAMLPITLLYTTVGFFGYIKYGDDSKGSITLNLPDEHLLAQSVKLMLSFSVFITQGLQCYVAIDIIWNQKLKHKVTRNSLFWEYVTRTLIVFSTFIFAALIPDLELFISFIGAFSLSTLGLSFPALIQMVTFWDFYPSGISKVLFFCKNFAIILIALLGFIVGVSTSSHEIYLKFFADL